MINFELFMVATAQIIPLYGLVLPFVQQDLRYQEVLQEVDAAGTYV